MGQGQLNWLRGMRMVIGCGVRHIEGRVTRMGTG